MGNTTQIECFQANLGPLSHAPSSQPTDTGLWYRKLQCLLRGTKQGVLSVHFSSAAQSCLTLCDPMDCSIPVFPIHHQLPELAQTHVHGVGDAIQPSYPLSPLLLLFSIFPSIRVFSKEESVLRIRWPNYRSFSFNISPFSEYSGLISFRMDRLDLLAVQRALKSRLQHYSSKASILWHSAFFIVQLSHPYMTTG